MLLISPYKRQIALILAIACGVMVMGTATAVHAQTGGPYAISPVVIASGGQSSSSTGYSVQSTVGQPAVGSNASIDYSVCAGYWCSAGLPAYRAYLPLTVRT